MLIQHHCIITASVHPHYLHHEHAVTHHVSTLDCIVSILFAQCIYLRHLRPFLLRGIDALFLPSIYIILFDFTQLHFLLVSKYIECFYPQRGYYYADSSS
ncbi:hypothetical protein CPB83DRAFT_842208 [Crepidotus variabilis]|uniref:Uncharacterized protein n=1 Tax=Crepidotus variabilis TaxID=179855 RepID=A0A9P6JX02_9AGAR|nr:hypothetical protein CPB83DRAFT_842208 [Crepidotus variabilis]